MTRRRKVGDPIRGCPFMLDAPALGELFTNSLRGAVEAGPDLPPIEPDEARGVSWSAIQLFLIDLQRPGEDGERLPAVISFKGLDFVDNLYLYQGWPTPSRLTFENCRFRAGATFEGLAFRNLSIRNSVIGRRVSVIGCAIAHTLTLHDTEAESFEIRRTTCRRASFASIHARKDGEALLADVTIDNLVMIATRCAELKIDGGSFDTMNLGNHAAIRSSLSRVRCGKKLTVQPSSVAENLLIRDLESEGDVQLNVWSARANALHHLIGCKIARDLSVWGASDIERQATRIAIEFCEIGEDVYIGHTRAERVSLFRTNVTRNFRISASAIDDLSMTDCRIERDLDLVDSTFDGPISLDEVKVGRAFSAFKIVQTEGLVEQPGGGKASTHHFRSSQCSFDSVDFRKCQLQFSGEFSRCRVASDVDMTDCASPLQQFSNVTIAGDAAFAGTDFGRLEIENSSARILTFSADLQERRPLAKDALSLSGSNFGKLRFASYRHRDDPASFLPLDVDLAGCTYDALPSMRVADSPELLAAFREKLVARPWGDHDPQPYFQMARRLRENGHLSEANRLQYLERTRAMRQAFSHGRGLQGLWLGALWAFIGFGIGLGYFRAIFWVLLFTAVGTIVLAWSPPANPDPLMNWLWRVGASLDQVLPVAKLSAHYTTFFEEKTTNTLTYWQNAYFAFQRFFGWLMATFVVAGLAGLTQKPA
jgi:hypothetical protein